MLDFTKAEDLTKGSRSIGNFFAKRVAELEKTQALHATAAAHHAGMASSHTTYGVAHKAMHDSLPADHLHKAFHSAGNDHHTAMAAHHDGIAKAHAAHADTLKAEVDAMKSMAAEWGGTVKAAGPVTSILRTAEGGVVAPPTTPTGNVMVDMVNETSAQLMAKTLSMMDTDPEVQQVMREQVLKMVSEAIGKTVIPTAVSAVAPPKPGVTMVPRTGAPAAPAPPNVEPQFAKLVSIDNEEEVSRSILR